MGVCAALSPPDGSVVGRDSADQDSFVFSDTIANNITECDERPDLARLRHAVQTANIQSFIEALPLGYNTKIGAQGNGISQGQRQRMLIARAIYQNPAFLFFDDANNALDANNERTIVENLEAFYHILVSCFLLFIFYFLSRHESLF